MKVLSLATILALVATAALAHNSGKGGGYGGCGGRCGGGGYGGSSYSHDSDGGSVAVGGNNNEGRVSGILNNVAKGGVLASNDKNSDTTVVQGYDH